MSSLNLYTIIASDKTLTSAYVWDKNLKEKLLSADLKNPTFLHQRYRQLFPKAAKEIPR